MTIRRVPLPLPIAFKTGTFVEMRIAVPPRWTELELRTRLTRTERVKFDPLALTLIDANANGVSSWLLRGVWRGASDVLWGLDTPLTPAPVPEVVVSSVIIEVDDGVAPGTVPATAPEEFLPNPLRELRTGARYRFTFLAPTQRRHGAALASLQEQGWKEIEVAQATQAYTDVLRGISGIADGLAWVAVARWSGGQATLPTSTGAGSVYYGTLETSSTTPLVPGPGRTSPGTAPAKSTTGLAWLAAGLGAAVIGGLAYLLSKPDFSLTADRPHLRHNPVSCGGWPTWRIVNRETGTDLAEIEAPSRTAALRTFKREGEFKRLLPSVDAILVRR